MSSGFGIGAWNVVTGKVVRSFVTLHNKSILYTVSTIPQVLYIDWSFIVSKCPLVSLV